MKRVAAALAVFVVLAGVAFLVVRRSARDDSPVAGLQAIGDEPFGSGDELDVTAVRAVLGPDATRLAVVTDDGLSVAQDGRLRNVTQPGSHVVDAAWFGNGATLLVAEGPIPTGGLAVVDLDGHVRGTVPLSPSVGFGTGHGMVVLPGGKRAVVTAVDRPALGPEERHLVLVDLTTGATSPLTEPGGPDEEGPVAVGEGVVAFTSTAPGGAATVQVLDVGTDRPTDVVAGTAVGGGGDRWIAFTTGSMLRAIHLPDVRRDLAAIPEGQRVVSADPAAGQAVLLDRAGHLHRIRFDPVAITR